MDRNAEIPRNDAAIGVGLDLLARKLGAETWWVRKIVVKLGPGICRVGQGNATRYVVEPRHLAAVEARLRALVRKRGERLVARGRRYLDKLEVG